MGLLRLVVELEDLEEGVGFGGAYWVRGEQTRELAIGPVITVTGHS